MLSFAEIRVGTGDAVVCVSCGAVEPASYAQPKAILDAVSEVVDGWASGPGPNVVLSGPEPYGHPQLPDIVTGAVKHGVQRLSLRTDGAALADEMNANGSIAAGVRHVEIVLLGGSAHTHDQLAGRKGAFDSALAGMRTFSDVASRQGKNVLVCGRVHVCGHNVKDLPGITLAYAGAGASSVLLDIDESLPAAVVRPWVDAAVETGIVNGLWVSVAGMSAEQLRIDPLHEIEPMSPVVVGEVG